MTIATLADFLSSLRQNVQFQKVSTAFAGPGVWCSSGLLGGTPAAIPAIGSAAVGVVPVAGDTGFPTLSSTSGGYYIDWAEYAATSTVTRVIVYDRLFHCGLYTTSDSITLGSQPSYSSRVPGGTDYTGLQIWLEKINTVASAATVTVTYTDQDGNTGATTGGVSNGVTNNIFTPCPLASGDSGLQKIESVTSSGGGAASTFNVVVVRPLMTLYMGVDNRVYGRLLVAGQKIPRIYSTSALALIIQQDQGQPTTVEMQLEIASG